MIFCMYQSSRSFTDLSPRSLRFSSFKIFSKTAGLIETKLRIIPQWAWEMKVCSCDLDHITKMASIVSGPLSVFVGVVLVNP